MPYLQKYWTNFQKLFFAERSGGWLLSLRISNAQTFWFSNSNVTTFPTSWKCKNFNFRLYTVPAEMLYLQKYLTNFQKRFFLWKKKEGGYCRWKFQTFFSLKEEGGGYRRLEFQVHRHFRFPTATLQLFQHFKNVKISIFPFTLSRQKCYISRGI